MESTGQVTQQLMFSLIQIWKESGKTQRKFCQEKDLSYHKFHYWFKKYNDQTQPSITSPTPTFTRLSIQKQQRANLVEVHYPDGRKLVFPQGVEATFLRTLLS